MRPSRTWMEPEWPTRLSGEGTRGQVWGESRFLTVLGFAGDGRGVGYYSSRSGKSLKSRTGLTTGWTKNAKCKKGQKMQIRPSSDYTKSGHGRGGLSDCRNDHPFGWALSGEHSETASPGPRQWHVGRWLSVRPWSGSVSNAAPARPGTSEAPMRFPPGGGKLRRLPSTNGGATACWRKEPPVSNWRKAVPLHWEHSLWASQGEEMNASDAWAVLYVWVCPLVLVLLWQGWLMV